MDPDIMTNIMTTPHMLDYIKKFQEKYYITTIEENIDIRHLEKCKYFIIPPNEYYEYEFYLGYYLGLTPDHKLVFNRNLKACENFDNNQQLTLDENYVIALAQSKDVTILEQNLNLRFEKVKLNPIPSHTTGGTSKKSRPKRRHSRNKKRRSRNKKSHSRRRKL
jgi:hypothetical protein